MTKTGLTSATSLVLAVGDLNRDSHLDIAANDTYGGIQILIGTGTGHFSLKSVITFNQPPGNLPTAMAIADFTGDGRLDIAVGLPTDYPIWYVGQACILPGYGDGTFNQNAATCSTAPYTFGEMVAGNLNGKQDLVFSSDPMMVQFNNGSGVMTPSKYAVGGGPMALGDFNADGRQDIAAGAVGGVQVVVNAATGVLRAPLGMDYAFGPFIETKIMNTTDFNGDGYGDLAVLNFFNEHGYLEPGIDVLLGGAKNSFTRAVALVLGSTPSRSKAPGPPAIGDFNHDGKLDIASLRRAPSLTTTTPPAKASPPIRGFSLGMARVTFPRTGPALETNSNFFAAGDFNGDGKADLASLDGPTFEILIGKGDGTFASPVTYSVGANPVFVLQRDLNGDGKKDILVVNQGSNDVSVLLGNGNGTFQPQKIYAAGTAPAGVVAGDFNRDGKIDIAVASKAGVSVLLGNGNGTFQAQKTYTSTGPDDKPCSGILAARMESADIIGINPGNATLRVAAGSWGTGPSSLLFFILSIAIPGRWWPETLTTTARPTSRSSAPP